MAKRKEILEWVRSVIISGSTDYRRFQAAAARQRYAIRFYEAWRLAIQRYGIYNPYTDRGAIKGLLPHGPHNVGNVLVTHILKQTGSYEQASDAIHDTATRSSSTSARTVTCQRSTASFAGRFNVMAGRIASLSTVVRPITRR